MTTRPTDLYGPIIHPPPGPPGPTAARWLAVVACPLGVVSLLTTAYLLVWFAWVTLPVAGLAWWLNAHAAARLSGPWLALAQIGRGCAIAAVACTGVLVLSMYLHGVAEPF